MERWDDRSGARGEDSRAGPRRVAARAGRHRRHRREVRQRRRGLAEADRFQERPGALHDVRAGRRVARVVRRLPAGAIRDAIRRPLRGERHQGARPRQAARGKARVGVAVHLGIDPRHSGIGGAGRSRNGAAAALPGVQRTRRRPRSAGADEAAARSGAGQPRPESRTGVRREDRRNQHLGPLHVEADDRRSGRAARSREDAGVLQGALLERRRLHLLHGRRLQGRSGACRCSRGTSGRCRRPARRRSQFKDIGVRFPTGVQKAQVEKGREPRSQTAISFCADPSFDPIEQEKRHRRDGGARNGAARLVARGSRADLHGIGRPGSVAAAARRRLHRRQLRRGAGKHRRDDRSRACRK